MNRRFEVDPLKDNILNGMLIFAFPIAVSALLTMLFSCADTAVIGKFGHENAISAVGVSASVLNFLVGGLTGLAGGVTVIAGKFYGESRYDKIKELLHALPLTTLILGAGLSICAIGFSNMILRQLNCPENILADALVYFRIYFLGVPLTAISGFLSAILQAKGNSYIPFALQIVASALNIALNLVFVIVLDWNVAGVAIATVISQFLLAAALILYMTRRGNELRLDLRKLTSFRGTKSVFAIGIPASLEGIVLNLSGVIIASRINRFDTAVIGGNTIATTIEGLMVVTFTGFASTSTVFISQNNGAGQIDRVRKTYRLTLATVFISAELVGILLYVFSSKLTALFTDDPAIMEYARTRMFYMCLFFGLCGIMNVVGGCERGLGDAKMPLYISILCSIILRLTWIFTYASWRGTVESIYVSYPICWGLCALLNMLAFRRIFKKRQRCSENKTFALPE